MPDDLRPRNLWNFKKIYEIFRIHGMLVPIESLRMKYYWDTMKASVVESTE